MGSNSEIQGYNMYPMLHFHRKFSSGITALSMADAIFNLILVVNWRSEIFITGLTKGCVIGIS